MEQKNIMNENEVVELLTNQIDSLMDIVNNIPDSILNTLTERSFKDASKLTNEEEVTLEKMTYSIYKAYILGMALGIKKQDEILNKN